MKLRNTFNAMRGLTREETGGTIAELAILLPFLIVMVAAVTELGRYFQTYSTLSKSTRAASRYLSKVGYAEPYLTTAQNIAYCGKQDCAGVDPVVTGLDYNDVELSAGYSDPPGGNPETVTVSINNYSFTPIFDVGALLGNSLSMAMPVRPSTTMYYMWSEPSGAEE
jgi:Flp pilus assembly protein TadG